MKTKKAELMVRSFWDHSGLEQHLEEMAAQGWMLDRIGSLMHYRRMEPAKLRFCITYCANASVYDPGPTPQEQELQEYSAFAGWTLAASSGQMQVYYTDQEDAIPLETDPLMEVENIHKTAKKTVFVQDLIFLLLGLFWLGIKGWECITDPAESLSDPTTLGTLAIYCVLIVICLADLGAYLRWRGKALQAATQGEFLPTTDMFPLQAWTLAAVTLCLVLYAATILTSGNGSSFIAFLLGAVIYLGTLFLVLQVRNALKRGGASRRMNAAVSIGVTAVCAIVFTGLAVGAILHIGTPGRAGYRWGREENLESYEFHTQIRYAYQDAIPLRVEDLLGDLHYDGYVTERDSQGTFLVSREEMMQYPRLDDPAGNEVPSLEYTVVSVHFPLLTDACQEDMLEDLRHNADVFGFMVLDTDPAPWGADAVWERINQDGTSWNQYLIRWGNKLVRLELDWTPDEAQKAMIAEKLSGR